MFEILTQDQLKQALEQDIKPVKTKKVKVLQDSFLVPETIMKTNTGKKVSQLSIF